MGTTTITLADDAYARLKSLKRDKESFSDVVRRMTKKRSLTEFAGILTEKEARTAERIIEKDRKRWREKDMQQAARQ